MSAERIWIYVIGKVLSDEQLTMLSEECRVFVNSWTAHEHKLNASFDIFKKQILIFKVDESLYNASGCSIDKLTHLIQALERKFSVELLNRLLVAYEAQGNVKIVHASKIREMISSGIISDGTLIYDTTISSSLQFKDFAKPLKNTWLNKYLPSFTS